MGRTPTEDFLRDKRIALAGTFTYNQSRKHVAGMLEGELGAVIAPGLSKTIDFLVVGGAEPEATATIRKRAAAIKVPVLEEDFVRRCYVKALHRSRRARGATALAKRQRSNAKARPAPTSQLRLAGSKLATSLQKAFGVELPARYRRFLQQAEFATHRVLVLVDGFVRGTFEPDFVDGRLADLSGIGSDFDIQDIDDIDWPADYGDYVPLATLTDLYSDPDEHAPVRAFLVIGVTDAACPVALWDYDGWTLYPIAASLDEFLAGKAVVGKWRHAHSRLGHRYRAFRWTSPAALAKAAE